MIACARFVAVVLVDAICVAMLGEAAAAGVLAWMELVDVIVAASAAVAKPPAPLVAMLWPTIKRAWRFQHVRKSSFVTRPLGLMSRVDRK